MKNTYQTGFTLIEVAIVLLIIGALLAASFMPLRAQRESANIQKAREQLNAIEEALYGFAIANSRLPCPTQPGLNGQENPVGGGVCTNSSRGFVPSATLGLKGDVNCDGLLMDPWNNPYRYSVTLDDHGVQGVLGSPDFTTFDDMRLVTITNLTLMEPFLRVCTDNACGTTVADNAVAVFFSMGSDRTASLDQMENAGEGGTVIASTCGLSAYPLGNDGNYVYHDRRETAGNEFDDIVFWLSPNILYSKMLSAGRL